MNDDQKSEYQRGYDAGRKATADNKIIDLLERFLCVLNKTLDDHHALMWHENTALREELRARGVPVEPVNPGLVSKPTFTGRYEHLAQGRPTTGRQADYIIADDPTLSQEAAASPGETEKLSAWAGRLHPDLSDSGAFCATLEEAETAGKRLARNIHERVAGRPSFSEEVNRHTAVCNARAEKGVVEDNPQEALPPRPATLFEPALKENWQIPDYLPPFTEQETRPPQYGVRDMPLPVVQNPTFDDPEEDDDDGPWSVEDMKTPTENEKDLMMEFFKKD